MSDEMTQEMYYKKLGDQANEIGELRKLVDNYILKEETSPEKFTEDPVKATERLIEAKTKPLNDALAAQQARDAEAKVAAVHPDYQEVLRNPSFQEWVNSSPINSEAMKAAASGNIDAGIALMTQYKQSSPGSQDKLQAATTSVRGSSRDTGTRADSTFRRADLIRMKIEDPARYRELNAEIMKAYAEGRVK